MSQLTKHTKSFPSIPSFPSIFDDLFTDFMSSDRSMDRIMKRMFPKEFQVLAPNMFEKSSFPKINVKEYSDKTIIEAGIAGLDKEDIKITIDDNSLTIAGKCGTNKEDKDEECTYLIRELKYSEFSRSFNLPDNMYDLERVLAEFKNNLLYITLPKLKEEPKKLEREVKII